MLSQVEVGATPRHRFLLLSIFICAIQKGLMKTKNSQLLDVVLIQGLLYTQMYGGERHNHRVRWFVSLYFSTQPDVALQSVGIRSHLLRIHHRYRCKNTFFPMSLALSHSVNLYMTVHLVYTVGFGV